MAEVEAEDGFDVVFGAGEELKGRETVGRASRR
jgi:hypothetical protein